MPVVEVKLYEERLTDELAAQLIEKMTKRRASATGSSSQASRPHAGDRHRAATRSTGAHGPARAGADRGRHRPAAERPRPAPARPRAAPGTTSASRARAGASSGRSASRGRSCRAASDRADAAARARSRRRCGRSPGRSRASGAAPSRRARGCRAARGRRGGSPRCPSTGARRRRPSPRAAAPSWPMKATSEERRTRTRRGRAPPSRTPSASASTSACARPPIVSRSAVAERRPDGDHDLVGRPAPPPPRPLGRARARRARRRGQAAARARAAAPAAAPSARPRGASPCPGPVYVRVVHGRVDVAVRADDRRGLEVVGGDRWRCIRHRLGDVGEAALVERARDVRAGDPLGEHAVGGGHVGGAVAVREVAAVVAVGRRLHLLVRYSAEAELAEHGLDRPRAALATAHDLVLGERLDPGVDLPVALQTSATRRGRRRRSCRRRTCCRGAASRSSPR